MKRSGLALALLIALLPAGAALADGAGASPVSGRRGGYSRLHRQTYGELAERAEPTDVATSDTADGLDAVLLGNTEATVGLTMIVLGFALLVVTRRRWWS